MNDADAALRKILLIEHDGLVRGTVTSVCRQLQLARVRQETSVAAGETWLKTGAPQAMLLSLGEGEVALAFLGRLRAGALPCPADLPVVVMAHAGDAALVLRLKELDVRRLLLQPFKLRDVIHTLEQLWPQPEDVAA